MSNDIQLHTNVSQLTAHSSQLTSLIKDRVDRCEEEFRDDLDRPFQGNDGVVSAHVALLIRTIIWSLREGVACLLLISLACCSV